MTPASTLHGAAPARLAALLGHGLSGAMIERVSRSPRLQDRLAALIAARLEPVPLLNPAQAAALAMTADGLSRLAQRAGAVWYARWIARTIDAASQRTIVSVLGTDRYREALAAIHIAPLEQPEPADLPAAITAAGSGCLAGWCAAQPPGVAARIDLLRPNAAPTPDQESLGPAIIDWLLAA